LHDEGISKNPFIYGIRKRINLTAIKQDYEKRYKKLKTADIQRLRILSIITFNDTRKFNGTEDDISTDEIYRLAGLTPNQNKTFKNCIVKGLELVLFANKTRTTKGVVNDNIVKARWKLRLAAQMLYPEHFKSNDHWKKLKADTIEWYESEDNHYSRFLQTDLLKKLKIVIDHLYDTSENFSHLLLSGKATRIRRYHKLSHIINRLFDGSAYKFIEICNKELYDDLELDSKKSGISRFTNEEILDLIKTKLTLSNHLRLNYTTVGNTFFGALQRWRGVSNARDLIYGYESEVLQLSDEDIAKRDIYTEILGFSLFTFSPREATELDFSSVISRTNLSSSQRRIWNMHRKGLSIENIASESGHTTGGVKSSLSTTRNIIRVSAENIYGERLVSGKPIEDIQKECKSYLRREFKKTAIKNFFRCDLKYKVKYILTNIAEQEDISIEEIPHKLSTELIKKHSLSSFVRSYFEGNREKLINFAFDGQFNREDFTFCRNRWDIKDPQEYLYEKVTQLKSKEPLTRASLKKAGLLNGVNRHIGNMSDLKRFLDTYQSR
ncbi:hypothetical protein GOV12_02635, partial [Candidatus Pacearchaeota archaeon]|nr:hypothetical protein [Candidatus Pacearchaeota archaeon]